MKQLTTIFLSSLLITGCIHHQEAPETHKYALNTPNITTSGKKSDSVTRLLPATIAPEFSSLGFTYRISDTEFKTDPYEQFINGPDLLITHYLFNQLSEEVETKLIDSQSLELNNQALTLNITKLYADYREKSHPLAVTEIKASFYTIKDGLSTEVSTQTFSQTTAISPDNPESLIAGFETNLTAISKQIAGMIQ